MDHPHTRRQGAVDAAFRIVRFGSVALVEPAGVASASPPAALLRAAETLASEPDLSVAVLAMRGNGADRGDGADRRAAAPPDWDRVMAAWAALRPTTIGALDGSLASADVALAAVLDFRVASRGMVLTAYCCGSEPNCLHPRLAEVCGQVRHFALSPHRPIHAPEALMAGLIDEIVAPGRVIDEAIRWAQLIAGRPVAARIMARLAIRAQGHRQRVSDDDGAPCGHSRRPDEAD